MKAYSKCGETKPLTECWSVLLCTSNLDFGNLRAKRQASMRQAAALLREDT